MTKGAWRRGSTGAIAGAIVALLAAPGIAFAAPDTIIDSGPNGTVASTSATFTFHSTETGSTFQCALDGAGFGACPAGYTGLAQGSHVFQVRATSASGTDPSPASRTWTVDTVAPNTSIDTGPNGTVASTSASFAFSSNEGGVTFQCALDGAGFGACPAGYTGLAQGSHTLQVRAVDAGGNTDSSPASRTWTVDTVAPNTSIDTGPNGTVASTSATFAFSSNEGGVTFQCALDGAGFGACPAGYTGLAQGSHTLQVRAVDAGGNTDSSPASRTWTVDTVAPNTSIDTGPNGTVASTSASFAFSSNEGGVTFQCALDGAGFGACPAGYTGLAQGSHTLQVRAVDAGGNTDSSPASRTWTVDTVGPDTSITGGPAGPTFDATPTFTFGSTEAGTAFECAIDSGGFSSCTSPFTVPEQSDGPHAVSVRSVDAVGNVDASPADRSFVVDTGPPQTTIISGPGDGATISNPTPSFGFEASEPASFECAVDAGAFASCSSGDPLLSLADGLHTFVVRAEDAAGNADISPAARAFTIDTRPPDTLIEIAPPNRLRTNRPRVTAEFALGSTEPDGSFACSLDGAAPAPCDRIARFSVKATRQKGKRHTLTVLATDTAGNADPTPVTDSFRAIRR